MRDFSSYEVWDVVFRNEAGEVLTTMKKATMKIISTPRLDSARQLLPGVIDQLKPELVKFNIPTDVETLERWLNYSESRGSTCLFPTADNIKEF
jgi:hypothetical protein